MDKDEDDCAFWFDAYQNDHDGDGLGSVTGLTVGTMEKIFIETFFSI